MKSNRFGFWFLTAFVFSITFALSSCDFSIGATQPQVVTLLKSGPNAPNVDILRDDQVATLELDYEAGNPWTPFDIGNDGLGPVGYRVTWIPFLGYSFTGAKQQITAQRRTQLQPLINDAPYYVRVEYVNRLGEIVGDFAFGTFNGGSSQRVDTLRQQMTGFFDDFQQPEGLPDELKWNTSFSQTNDPAMQAFFINPQFHAHTLVGTPRHELFGDRGQATHRIRNRLNLGSGETRRIVFDIDGVNFKGRAIWYLDLVQEECEITSHVTVGGGAGSSGHPSPGLRFSLDGHHMGVYRFNEAGEQILVAENLNLGFGGAQMIPNVRRAVEIQLAENHVTVLIDGVSVIDSDISAPLDTGEYNVLWTAFGYNTLKVAMPYFLIHWDNFGFDGPASANTIHNYRSQVAGSDLIRCDDFQPQTVTIEIPDDLTPLNSSTGQARLVFTRQMNNWDPVIWMPMDTVTLGGIDFPIPEPVSMATPPLQLEDLINTNAAYSTYIPLGTVGQGGTAPLVQGANQLTFSASRCAFINVHIEVEYPNGDAPEYTAPQEIHYAPVHGDFIKVGLPARISRIGGVEVDNYVSHINDPANFNAEINGTIDIQILVNASLFVSDTTLDSDFVSASLAASGRNPGVRKVELWIRPDGGDDTTAVLLGSVNTDADVSAPQFVGSFSFDTTTFANGIYEVTVLAEDGRGVLSLPDFSSVSDFIDEAPELNGMYYPLHVTINN